MLLDKTKNLLAGWAEGQSPVGIGERLASGGLRLASTGWWLGAAARSLAFDVGLRKTGRVDCPVLCVGNLSTGGTGKTPLVMAIARHFRDQGRKVAVVTRGYRRAPIRNTPGSGVVMVSDGERLLVPKEAAGDEPSMMARSLPGVAIVVGARRLEAAQFARREWGADLILLDDGFQHRALERDCDIVLWDALQPPEAAALLPRGFLREGWRALRRAHAIVFTRCNLAPPPRSFIARIKRFAPQLLVFQSTLEAGSIRSLSQPDRVMEPRALASLPVGAFCGLGNPESFWKLLEALGANLVWKHAFPDHYKPNEGELSDLLARARRAGAERVLITEKDSENLPESWQPEMPVSVVPVVPELWAGYGPLLPVPGTLRATPALTPRARQAGPSAGPQGPLPMQFSPCDPSPPCCNMKEEGRAKGLKGESCPQARQERDFPMTSRYLALPLLATLLLAPLGQSQTAAQDQPRAIGVAPAALAPPTSPTLTPPTLAPPALTPPPAALTPPPPAPAPVEAAPLLPPPAAAPVPAILAQPPTTGVLGPGGTAEASITSPTLPATGRTSPEAPVPAGATAGDLATAGIDYQAFWYSNDPLDETKVQREQITSSEYERRKNSELETKWTPLYTDLLNGSVAKAVELGYTPDKAALMIQMDPVTFQRMMDSPTYKTDVIKQLAEWSLFYDQLDLWNKYVEQSVLREDLAESEKTDYNPATVETDLTSVYEKLQNHAKLKAEKLLKLYSNPGAVLPGDQGLVDRVEEARTIRKNYQEWLQDREKAMLAFADLWRHQYDGSEIWMGGTQYLVRNIREVPKDMDEDPVKAVMPDDAVQLNVAKGKTVTPFDIIREDGSLKTVDNQGK